MSLLETIEKARGRIQSGSLKNEQQVILAIIMPVLRDLGWDTTEPEQVFPEFTIGTGRVDYALLGANGTPLVLIEAKAHHRIRESSIDQLFRYAYGAGAGIIVLTDGQEWQLYLAQKTGVVAGDRLFCHLDLSNTPTETCEKALYRYLSRDNVLEHKAFRYANVDFDEHVQAKEKERQEKQERDKLRASLPKIWEELKQDQTSPLYELMSRAIEEAGVKKYPEIISEFISRLGQGQMPPTSESPPQRPPATYVSEQPPTSPLKVADSTKTPKSKIVGYTLYGMRYDTRNNPGTLQAVFSELMSRDPELVSKLEQARPKWFTSSRRFIAETLEKLYRNPNQRDRTRRLDNGYYIDINLGTYSVKEHIEEGCKVVGLRYGVDLILHEVLKSQRPQVSHVVNKPPNPPLGVAGAAEIPRNKMVGYTLHGEKYHAKNGAETLWMVFNVLISRDPQLEEKMRRRYPELFNNKRHFMGENREALFRGDSEYNSVFGCRQLNNGRYISTHMSSRAKENCIRMGCEVVGLQYGKDLTLLWR